MRTIGRHSKIIGFAALMVGMAIGAAPMATSDPTPGTQTADLIIHELNSEGYTVSINWTNGQDSSPPLSGCRVISFHNPDRSGTSAPQGTTVYVDVLCPNESED